MQIHIFLIESLSFSTTLMILLQTCTILESQDRDKGRKKAFVKLEILTWFCTAPILVKLGIRPSVLLGATGPKCIVLLQLLISYEFDRYLQTSMI